MAIFSKSFGKTQQKIGETTASIQQVVSYIFGIIFILAGLGLSIYSFIPVDQNDDTTIDTDKNDPDTTKKPNHILIVPGIFIILFGILIIFLGRWWNKFAHKNKTAAQLTAVGMEANVLSDILSK